MIPISDFHCPSEESAREGILSIWEIADIIKVSEEEISFLTNGEDPYGDAVVRKLFHPNPKLLLVTEGPDGCRYDSKDFSGRINGLKVDAVDTTGAEDAFVAGILSQLASDLSLLQVLLFVEGCTLQCMCYASIYCKIIFPIAIDIILFMEIWVLCDLFCHARYCPHNPYVVLNIGIFP